MTNPNDQPLSTLRAGRVDINASAVRRVLIVLVLAALALLTVLLTVAGIHKNSQINDLRNHGVTVTVRVKGCLGLLGGSGSNAAGYSCQGTFTLDGHRYTENIPGAEFYKPGTPLQAKTVPGDPALLSPITQVRDERTSGRVFILPAILAGVFVLLGGSLLVRQRRQPKAKPPH